MKKNNIKNIICLVLLLFAGKISMAQTTEVGATITKSSTLYGTQILKANKYVEFLPGFEYTAIGSSYLEATIDESIIAKADYLQGPIDMADYKLNKSLEVGSISGGAGVSPTGAATYRIPINIPAGTAGMQPSVGIAYSSQSGKGLLGYGWNLTGLSAITRVGKNYYHDGSHQLPQNNADDNFALDGQRLISLGKSADGNTISYKTEVENYAEITAYVHEDYKMRIKYFIVKTRDGKTILYGNDEDSYVHIPGKKYASAFMISEVKDIHGNYMTYEYGNTSVKDGEVYLQAINYTGNTNTDLAPYNKIEFFYAEKADKSTAYLASYNETLSHEAINRLIVRKIKTSYKGEEIRSYEFDYFYRNNNTYLNKVTAYAHTATEKKALNPTVIEWNVTDNETLTKKDFFLPSLGFKVATKQYTGDFNGDGKTDILRISTNKNKFFMNFNVMDHSGAEATIPGKLFENLDANHDFEADEDFKVVYPIIGDFDKDGRDDLLIQAYKKYSDAFTYDYYRISVLIKFNDNGYQYKQDGDGNNYVFEGMYKKEEDGEIGLFRSMGSFTGAGTEMLFSYNNYAKILYYSSDGQSWKIREKTPMVQTNPIWLGYEHNDDKVCTADFNGDGKTDILRTYEDEVSIYSHVEGNQWEVIYNGGFPTRWHDKIYPGDFNGDGKADLLTWHDTHGWELTYFNGTDFVWNNGEHYPINFLVNKKPGTDKFDIFINDFNADGRSDILEVCKVGDKNSFEYYFATGDIKNLFEEKIYRELHNETFYTDYLYFGDFTGKGTMDMIIIDYYADEIFNVFSFDNTRFLYKNQIQSVINGTGAKTEFEYDYLTNSSVYTKKNDQLEFFTDIQPAMQVVSSIKQPNGIGGQNTTEYIYEGAKTIKTWRKYSSLRYNISLGKNLFYFERTTVSNPQTNTKTVSHYECGTDFFVPYLDYQVNYVGDNAISRKEFDYSFEDIGDKRYKQKLNKTIESNHKNNTKVTTIYNNYDQYDNPQTIISSVAKIDRVDTESKLTTTKTMEYAYHTGSYIPSRISTTTKQQRPDEAAESRTQITLYNTKGQLTQKTIDPGDVNEVIEKYTKYDDYGHLLETEIYTTNPDKTEKLESTSSVAYDEVTHRFVVSKTNAPGHTATSDYDQKHARLKSKTGPNGFTTRYEYDDFGKKVKTTDHNGNYAKTTTHWATDADKTKHEHILFYSVSTASGQAPVTEYFDLAGRSVYSEYPESFNSSINYYTKTEYNNLGQVITEYEPTQTGTFTDKTINYQYDNYGRVTHTITPTGTIRTDYSDDGLTTTVTNEATGETSTKTTNILGETITATDAGGDITYSYYSSGLLKSTECHGQTTTITYDKQGNRKMLEAPGIDAVTTKYNALGQLTQQQTPNGNFSMTYDIAGRIKTKTDNQTGVVTTYTYDTGNKALGKLCKEETSEGYKKTMQYNDNGQLETITERIDGIDYSYHYKYDSYGNVTFVTYPTGLTVNNVYNANGYLGEVKAKPAGSGSYTNVWQASQIDAKGRLTHYKHGNGLTTETKYTDTDQLDYIKTGTVQNIDYDFDTKTGNLKGRTFKNYETEYFWYDDLNRLTDIELDDGGGFDLYTQTMSYDDNGNITFNSNVGEYKYEHPGKPHAVSEVTPGPAVESQKISYTTFDKVSEITSGDKKMTFAYRPDYSRQKVCYSENNSLTWTRYYVGSYEKEINHKTGETTHYNYIPTGSGTTAIFIKKDNEPSGSMYYLHSDHLGSIQYITDESQNIVQANNFDAWGRRRNADYIDNYEAMPKEALLKRGFTGHEHIPEFNLINMNGRLYDPMLGRMLSPDNYVQAPNYSQNFNRYSYCFNNPLSYVDPSGDFIWFVAAGAVLGAYIGGAIAAGDGGLTNANWNPFGGNNGSWQGTDWWKGAITGAIIGAGAGALTATAFGGATTAALMSNGVGGSSLGWSMTSSALTTANINIATTALHSQGDLDQMWKAGVSGLISGGISGGVNFNIGTKYNQIGFWKGLGIHGAVGGTTSLIDGAIQGKTGWDLVKYTAKGAAISGIMGGVTEGFKSRLDGKSFWTGSDKRIKVAKGCYRYVHRCPVRLNIDNDSEFMVAMFLPIKIGDKTISIPIGIGWDFSENNKKGWNTIYTHFINGTSTYHDVWYDFPVVIPLIPFIR